jgi:hypothetical protein
MALLVTARDQYLQEEQRHQEEHKHNVQNHVRGQMAGYSYTYKSPLLSKFAG